MAKLRQGGERRRKELDGDRPLQRNISREEAREIAEVINFNGPLAVEAILRTLRETETLSEEEAFAHEMTYGMAVMGSEDAKEGPRAFKEKRKPDFQRK